MPANPGNDGLSAEAAGSRGVRFYGNLFFQGDARPDEGFQRITAFRYAFSTFQKTGAGPRNWPVMLFRHAPAGMYWPSGMYGT